MTEVRQPIEMDIDPLLKAAHALLASLTFDDSGINGRGGNGGLLSRETVRKSDELRIILSRVEQALAAAPMMPSP